MANAVDRLAGCALVGIGWLVLLTFCAVRKSFSAWLLLVPAVLGALVVVVGRTDLAYQVGFAVARPAMEAAAVGPCPSWVGWYPVQGCETFLGHRVFLIQGAGFVNYEGFARFGSAFPLHRASRHRCTPSPWGTAGTT